MADIIDGQRVVQVGVVEQLSRYPVKSMRAEALTEANVTFEGIAGDRRFAFIQGHKRTNFPWLTARELPRMVLYRARLVDPSNPDKSDVLVTTPEGKEYDIFSEELLAELKEQLTERERNQPIYPAHLKSAFDAAHISLVTTHALKKLSDLVGEEIEPRRFRENLVINTDGSERPDEQSWIGSRVMIGEGERAAIVALIKGDERCMMPNLHPDTAEQDPRILRNIAVKQNKIMGVYGSVVQRGAIRLGDPVHLLV
ncbi:MAG: MOSC N-terminal beta barrel domain-containing protein [Chloroflexota bacterium]|nr:MOSC N-terminal beta barrel domain-containing protein [Chloroflexota bacterium]